MKNFDEEFEKDTQFVNRWLKIVFVGAIVMVCVVLVASLVGGGLLLQQILRILANF